MTDYFLLLGITFLCFVVLFFSLRAFRFFFNRMPVKHIPFPQITIIPQISETKYSIAFVLWEYKDLIVTQIT